MRTPILTLIPLLAVLPVGAEEKAGPTFNKDVAPILFQNCASCHRTGEGAPFALLTYADAKKRGKLLAHVTQSRQMPPWKAEKGDVAFRKERKLTDEQIAVVKNWFEAGMPEGDAKDLPKPPVFAADWPLGKPDLVVKMPKAYKVPAEGRDIYRNFAVSLGLKEDKYVRAIDFRPSARAVVHHSLFFLDPTGAAHKLEEESGQVGFGGSMGALGRGAGRGKGGLGGGGAGGLGSLLGGLAGEGGPQAANGLAGIGGWAVGGQARELPSGLAYRLPKGADLILSTHFHPSGKVEEEASSVAFYFADKPPVQRFTGIQLPFGFGILAGLDVPAGKKDYAIEDSFTLPIDVKAFAISPHAHQIAKDFKVTATLPDGKVKTLLHIPDWDFAWQEEYQFKDFVPLPKGTKVHTRIVYDNTADNPHNPNTPPQRIRWGRETKDEMGSISLQVVAENESEFPKLQEAYRKHILEAGLLRLKSR